MRANKIVRVKFTHSRNPKAIYSKNVLMTFSDWSIISYYVAVHEHKELNPYKWFEIWGPFEIFVYWLLFIILRINQQKVSQLTQKITSITLLIISISTMLFMIKSLLY